MAARRRVHQLVALLIDRRRDPALVFLLLSGLVGCASAPPGPAAPPETPSGEPVAAVYTAEQATHGQRVFTTICATCHGRNEFTGPIFALTWMAEPVASLFEQVSTNMPQDRPGSLSAEEYAAVVAYILQLNGRAPGDRELPADATLLAGMRW